MSTITKEQLRERAREKVMGLEYALKHPGAFAETLTELEEELELARIALASLEAEAVAFVMAEDLKDSSIISTPAYRDFGEAMERTVGDVVALYAAHPAPVSVPAAYEKNEDFSAYHEGWNACRAAMLQGADGALTNEDAKRVDELVMWIKRLAHSLRKANPDSKLQSDAMDYLSRKGLIGVEDILR